MNFQDFYQFKLKFSESGYEVIWFVYFLNWYWKIVFKGIKNVGVYRIDKSDF